jgi:hypothetical protein
MYSEYRDSAICSKIGVFGKSATLNSTELQIPVPLNL